MLHDQIIGGMLPPGALAPGGTALVDETSYYTITCRCALKTLVADGMLAPDPGAREFRTAAPPVERPARAARRRKPLRPQR
jgi:DNA-binding GntR family transcriptional regulator